MTTDKRGSTAKQLQRRVAELERRLNRLETALENLSAAVASSRPVINAIGRPITGR
jgi:uncharacterized coiled-coil protein SlyX